MLPHPSSLILPKTLINMIFIDMQNTSEIHNIFSPKEILISHASKVMLKILQARLQKHMSHELTEVQAGFKKVRGTRDQIVNIC